MNKSLQESAVPAVRMESLEVRRLCALSFQFDYRYDTSGFFSSQSRKDVLVAAGKALASRLADTFDAVVPSGGNTWSINLTAPGSGQSATISNPSVAANTIVVYVGARDLAGNTLGQGGPTGWGASGTSAWIDAVRGRGETGATASPRTDFAPKAGAITFDSPTNWFFGTTLTGIGGSQTDFYSVATHELGHVLGIGVGSETWPKYLSNGTFNGPKTKALYGKGVPVSSDGGHLAEGVFYGGVEAAMDPTIKTGTRKSFTALDYAILDDIGYDLTYVATTGKITGNLWNDNDSDGIKDTGETALAGWQVFLDKDKDGVYDSGETTATTDTSGNYTFTVTPGSYRVVVTAKTGFRRTTPSSGNYDVTVTAGSTASAKNFSYTQKVLLTGQVFKDSDGDGVKDSGETGLSGWRVFIDKDGDGVLDTGESYVTTDSGGNWSFKAQSAGTFKIRVVQQSGYTLKSPTSKYYSFTLTAGQTKPYLNFAEKPA